MEFHKVEVDDDVFEFVKAHAEPLVDSFNSVLRRLLLTTGLNSNKSEKQVFCPIRTDGLLPHLPNLPNQTPKALRHILEVACLVRGDAYDRSAATRFVAKQHDVFYQTVLDKYCRQLNLKTREFDRLLEQPGLTDLKNRLKSKFPDYQQLINETLSSGSFSKSTTTKR